MDDQPSHAVLHADASVTDNCNPRTLSNPRAHDIPLGQVPWETVNWWKKRPVPPNHAGLQQPGVRGFEPTEFIFAMIESLPRYLAAPRCKECPNGATRSVPTAAPTLSSQASDRLWNWGADPKTRTVANSICAELWARFRTASRFNDARCSLNGGCESFHFLVDSVKCYRFPVPNWESLQSNYHVKLVSSRNDGLTPYPGLVNAVGQCKSKGFATAVADGIIIPVGAKNWLEGRDSHDACLGAGWRAISDYASYQPEEDEFTRLVIEGAAVGEAVRLELLLHASESERASDGIGSEDIFIGAALRRLVEAHVLSCTLRHEAAKRTWLLALLWMTIHDLADLRADFANKNSDNWWLWWDNPRDAAVSSLFVITSVMENNGWSWWHHAAYALFHVWRGRRYNLGPNAGKTCHAAIPSLKIPRGIATSSRWDGLGHLEDELAVGFLKETPDVCEPYWAAAIDLWNAQCDVGFGGIDLDMGAGRTESWGHA